MLRKSTIFRMFGNLFVLFIVMYMLSMYYTFIYLNGFEIPNKSTFDIFYLFFANFCFCMAGIAFIQTIVTDPGRVPVYWGFYLDDPDHKRKRYCLICHIFKPERCHHCSSCNRCVLNMDHHCPWLNNCIGFFNRKFFLLLLFYGVTLKGSIVVYYLPTFCRCLDVLWINELEVPFEPVYLTTIAYIINAVMFGVLGTFFKFHVRLLQQNLTTIEHMEKKRNISGEESQNYDMGLYYNFVQIFGRDPMLWLVPFFFKTGKPLGDGVVWPQKPSKVQLYEIEVDNSTIKGGFEETYKSPKMNGSMPPTGNVTPKHEDFENGKASSNQHFDFVSARAEKGFETRYYSSQNIESYRFGSTMQSTQQARVNAYGMDYTLGSQQSPTAQQFQQMSYRFPSKY